MQRPSQSLTLWAAAIPVALAFLFYASNLTGAFVSDDFTIVGMLLDRTASTPTVDWSRVWADFSGPWMGVQQLFYRPLATLSFAIDTWIGGSAPGTFYLTNISLHAVNCGLIAWLCGLYVPGAPRLAALAGGCMFALHPACNEVTSWLSARTTAVEFAFHLVAVASFLRALHSGRRRWHALAGVTCIGALLSLETALLLPAWLLAADVFAGPKRTLRSRACLHLAYAPLWIAYLLWRYHVLGLIAPNPVQAEFLAFFWRAAGSMQTKFLTMFYPLSELVPWWARVGMLLGPLVVFASTGRRWWRPLLTVALGSIVLFTPTYTGAVTQDLIGSRYVYGAIALLSICLAWSMGQSDRRLLTTAGLVITGVSMASAATGLNKAYRQTWDNLPQLQASINQVGSQATPRQPIVLVRPQSPAARIFYLAPQAMFSVAEPPWARGDYPFVGLANLWYPVSPTINLMQNPQPIRAMWEFGGTILTATAQSQGVIDLSPAAAPRSQAPALSLRPRQPGTFECVGGPWSPFLIEAARLRWRGPPRDLLLEWFSAGQGSDQERGQVVVRHAHAADGVSEAWVDLTSNAGFLLDVAAAGGLSGLRVASATGDGPALPQDLELQLVPRVGTLPLPNRLGDRTVALTSWWNPLRAPTLPEDAPLLRAARDAGQQDAIAMELVLMSPMVPIAMPVRAGAPVVPPPLLQHGMAILPRFVRVPRLYYYYIARWRGRTMRSAVDFFMLDAEK